MQPDGRDEHPLGCAVETQRTLPSGLVTRQQEHPSGGGCRVAGPIRVLNDYLI